MKELITYLVSGVTVLFVICFLIRKFSDFRRNNGFNRILKHEYLKNKK